MRTKKQPTVPELISALKRSRSIEEAIQSAGYLRTPSSLRRLFASKSIPAPSTYLGVDAAPVDPVERADKEDSAVRLRREHSQLIERVREAEERQHVLDRLKKPVKQVSITRRETTGREGTAVVLASDWHVEEYVPRRNDTAGNFYDLAEADKRVRRFFDGTRWLVEFYRPTFKIRDLVLWLGGDLMTGYLRNENREENQLSPVETLAWLQARITAGIDHLLADGGLDRLVVVCSHGNHGRTTEKRQVSTGAKNSYEWLLYQWLAVHYANEKRIEFVTDQSNHQYLQVYDFNLHFTHGDEVQYQGGIGGIAVPLMKAVAGWDQVRRCDYHHIGHWHQLRDFGNITVNGSLIGYNAYAMSVRAAPEPPRQAFYVLDSKRGKTANCPVWVTG